MSANKQGFTIIPPQQIANHAIPYALNALATLKINVMNAILLWKELSVAIQQIANAIRLAIFTILKSVSYVSPYALTVILMKIIALNALMFLE